MNTTHAPSSSSSTSSTIGQAIRGLLVFDTVALVFAAALHVDGASVSVGNTVFTEPQIVPAAVVEGLAAVLFGLGVYAVFATRVWAWTSAISAHIFAILGFLLGLYATRDGTSPFNFTYHRVMLAIFAAGLLLLLLPAGRGALSKSGRMR
jgi:hypothetical protein